MLISSQSSPNFSSFQDYKSSFLIIGMGSSFMRKNQYYCKFCSYVSLETLSFGLLDSCGPPCYIMTTISKLMEHHYISIYLS